MTSPAPGSGVLSRCLSVLAIAGCAMVAPAFAEEISLDSDRWTYSGDTHKVEQFAGRRALFLQNAVARLEGTEFLDGTIEFDIYLPSEERGFSGIYWRLREGGNGEDFYLRHHQSGMPDANQYTPLFNRSAAWQLYYGPQFALPTLYRYGEWMPIRVVSAGDEADIYIDSDEPSLRVHLKNEPLAGTLALYSAFAPAWFSNLRVAPNDGAKITGTAAPPIPAPAPGTVTTWEISDAFAEAELDGATDVATSGRTWTRLAVEDRGYANLARVQGNGEALNTAFARVVITSDSERLVPIRFGYSDKVRVYANGQLLYSGDNTYQSRDYRYLGTIGLFDGVSLNLEKGENELLFAVTEAFGGWGVMAQIEDLSGLTVKP